MKAALEIVCANDKFKPLSIDMENVDTKTKEILDLDSELFNQKCQMQIKFIQQFLSKISKVYQTKHTINSL